MDIIEDSTRVINTMIISIFGFSTTSNNIVGDKKLRRGIQVSEFQGNLSHSLQNKNKVKEFAIT